MLFLLIYFLLPYVDTSTTEDAASLAGSSANTHEYCHECAHLEVLMSSLKIGTAMKNSPRDTYVISLVYYCFTLVPVILLRIPSFNVPLLTVVNFSLF